MIKVLPPFYLNPLLKGNTAEYGEPDRISYRLGKPYKQEEHGNYQIKKKALEVQFSLLNPKPQEVDKYLEKEGKDEQVKIQASKNEADRQKVKDLVKMSNRCIFSISTQFPWNIFPNTIDVEEDRVTFTFRQFLGSQSHSVDIKDISNVFIESSLFSATLQVVSHTYIQNDIKIGYLDRKKAEKTRRIIEGLRTFAKHNINTSNYEIIELIEKIEEFHASLTVP